jgi:heme-degrading monooxygenase HmoA
MMIVRIASVQVAPERIDEIVGRYRETVRPIHEHSDGLRNHYVLVDRQSGRT